MLHDKTRVNEKRILKEKSREIQQGLLRLTVKGPPAPASALKLQSVVNEMLEEKTDLEFSHNSAGELIANWQYNTTVNITEALKRRPYFGYITLSPSQLDKYLDFLKHQSTHKPTSLEPSFYSARERSYNMPCPGLHLAEKIALNIYTSQAGSYVGMNEFLRGYAMAPLFLWKYLTKENLQLKAKDVLLAIIVAAQGWRKLPYVFSAPSSSAFREDTITEQDLKKSVFFKIKSIRGRKAIL